MAQTFYELIGGRKTLEAVHKTFYDKLLKDPWLKPFFEGIDQKHIENQQSDFMGMHFGGPPSYMGVAPKASHRNMFITREILIYRAHILAESILANGLSREVARDWIAKERLFYKQILKENKNECSKKLDNKDIIIVEKPTNIQTDFRHS